MTEPAPLTRDEAIDVRRLQYEFVQAQLKHTMEMQGGYGKWLLASLLLVHGGIFAFLVQNEKLSASILPHVFWWLVSGLVLALISGFATWWNWTFAARVYSAFSPLMIYGDEHLPKFGWRQRAPVVITMYLAIVLGLGSVACVVGAAVRASALFVP